MIFSKQDIQSLVHQLAHLEVTDGMGIFEEFRQKIKGIFHTPYILLTNNGTSALYLAYKAIGLELGDEVITGTYTYHSTNSTLFHFTQNIIFCDYDEDIRISLQEIKKKISHKTKLLVLPHTWGLCPDMDKVIELKREYPNLKIIEDCSQAHLAQYNGTCLGTFGDIGVFSMQGGKLLTSGEGGFAITKNLPLYEKMLVHSDSGNTLSNLLGPNSDYRKYIDTGLGLLKFRPNPLGIAFANSQVDSLFEKIKIRRLFAEMIKKELVDLPYIQFPPLNKLNPSYYALVGLYDEKKNNNISIDEFLSLLRRSNIFDVYSPKNNTPNHLLPLFIEKLGERSLPKSEHIYKNLLFFKISDDITQKVALSTYIQKFKIVCQ